MKTDEKTALSTLTSATGTEEKARACKALAAVGGPESVPALAALLGDPKLSSHARSGLETIRDASAGEALRKALPGLKGSLLAGAVTSLGVRREAAAVPDLQKMLETPDRGASEPALAALAHIASPEAVKTIAKVLAAGPPGLHVPAAHAALAAAERLVRDGRKDAARTLLERVRAADVPPRLHAAAGRGMEGL